MNNFSIYSIVLWFCILFDFIINLVLVFFFVPVLGIEASITKFLDAAKAVEADFLRKQMYSRVHHPREVTQDVRVAENLSFYLLLFHE